MQPGLWRCDLRLCSREALADDLRLERTPLVHLVGLVVLRQPRLALLVDHEHEANHAATKSTARAWRRRRAVDKQRWGVNFTYRRGRRAVRRSPWFVLPSRQNWTRRRARARVGSPSRLTGPPQLMGREESKEQAKAAQREKEAAAHGKKQERKDKVWEKGAKDSTKADASAASGAEAAERKAAAAAQVRALARVTAATLPACVARLVWQRAHAKTHFLPSPESPWRRLGRRRRRRARGAVATRRRRRRRATR